MGKIIIRKSNIEDSIKTIYSKTFKIEFDHHKIISHNGSIKYYHREEIINIFTKEDEFQNFVLDILIDYDHICCHID